VIYADRRLVLEHGDVHDRILRMIRSEVGRIVDSSVAGSVVTEEAELETLFNALEAWVHIPEEFLPENIHAIRRDQLKKDLIDLVIEHYEKRGEELKRQAIEQGVDEIEPLREFERSYLLQVLDRLWMDHIDSLDVMRAGISLRAVGQRDPLVEFKSEAFRMFEDLKQAIQHYTVDALLKLLRNDLTITLNRPEPPRKMPRNLRTNAEQIAEASGQAKSDNGEERNRSTKATNRASRNGSGKRGNAKTAATPTNRPTIPARIGRNDPCPCGSGKKYKKCHGA
jgi:preprotein translocase subunit SecA